MSYTQIKTAFRFAAHKHNGQLRKGTDLPYIIHPTDVGMYLNNLRSQNDIVIAGYLHDTLEDTDTTYDELLVTFGPRVADAVLAVTETDKIKAYENAKHYSADALMVKTADLFCNVSDIKTEFDTVGDTVFKKFSNGKDTLKHYKKLAQLLKKKAKFMPLFQSSLDETLTMIDSMS